MCASSFTPQLSLTLASFVQLGRLSCTLTNVATASKAAESEGNEKLFLMGQTSGYSSPPRELRRPVVEATEEDRFERDSLDGETDFMRQREFVQKFRGDGGKREGRMELEVEQRTMQMEQRAMQMAQVMLRERERERARGMERELKMEDSAMM